MFSNGWKCEKKKFDEKKYFSQSFIVCKVEEKWVKINFYKFIGCIGEKKKDEYNFWVIFQQFFFLKKKNSAQEVQKGFWAIAQIVL